MQRTIICGGGGGTNTYTVPLVPYYSPLGGPGPVGSAPGNNTTVGTGAYGRNRFSCVLSKLYLGIGKIITQPGAVQCQINIGGATPAAGNLNASSGAPATFGGSNYYYDATDIDALTAGQQVGLVETLTGTSGTQILAQTRGVVCDSVDQGVSATYGQNASPGAGQALNGSPRYTSLSGGGSTCSPQTTIPGVQGYAAQAFVASGLNWQSGPSNTTTSTNATCAFAHNPTQGVNTATSLTATIQSAGFTGMQYDATDIAAVPAGDYYNYYWTGTSLGNSLHLVNTGIYMQGASNNSCVMASSGTSGTGATWPLENPTFNCFNQGVRFDDIYYEAAHVVPTSGVFSNLYVGIGANTYASPTTFTILNGPTAGDTGAGVGHLPETGAGNPPTPANLNIGFNATSIQATVPASTLGWAYDATDIAAFVGGTNQLLCEVYATGGGATAPTGAPNAQATTITFTAPAHLGLTTQGVG